MEKSNMEKSNMEKSNMEEQMEYDENFDESFIIDENTYNDIINNSINICKKKDENICYYCKKEIINFFANNCKDFEDQILYNKYNEIRVKKTELDSLYLFFDPEEIKNNYKVISAWNFINLALTNIFFNTDICNNMYFKVSHVLTKGTKYEMLENDKNYIKIYLDMYPLSDNIYIKEDTNNFIYLKNKIKNKNEK